MELNYDINSDGSISNVRFDGLDGYERVTTIKQAVSMLQIQNPAVVFTKNVKAGEYDCIPDKEYMQLLSIINRFSLLWRYADDEPANKLLQSDMNVLMLLANAIEMISQMHMQLQQVPLGTVQPPQDGV